MNTGKMQWSERIRTLIIEIRKRNQGIINSQIAEIQMLNGDMILIMKVLIQRLLSTVFALFG